MFCDEIDHEGDVRRRTSAFSQENACNQSGGWSSISAISEGTVTLGECRIAFRTGGKGDGRKPVKHGMSKQAGIKNKRAKFKTAPAPARDAPLPDPETTAVAAGPARKLRLFPWRFSLAGAVHLAVILAVVSLCWCHSCGRFTAKSWSQPLVYSADGYFVLSYIKAASEFNYVPFCYKTVDRLGAPYQANWNDYPFYEQILIFGLGMVARKFGLFPATNVAVLLSFLTSAAAFYACCRLFRYRREWAAAGAVIFAFAWYNTNRGLGHLLLSYSYVVPLAVVSAMLLTASRRLKPRQPFFWFCVVVAFLMGLSNPYHFNMWLQFVCLGLAVRWLQERRRPPLAAVAVPIVGVLGFLSAHIDTFAYQWVHGANPAAVPRAFFQLELYALRPIELLLPPPNYRIAFIADISKTYGLSVKFPGEMFSAYLGVVALVALLWLTGEFVVRVLKVRRRPRRLPLYAPFCLWVVLYSVHGGVNSVLGLGGIYYFRGANRYSIFISALCLLFLVARMSRIVRGWNRFASYALALGLVALALADQLPPPPPPGDVEAIQKAVDNDRAFGRALEASLPHGAMVFETPPIKFPEAGPVGDLGEYEQLRPFLHTTTLRFSFGSDQGRPREEWQQELGKGTLEQDLSDLERYGFSGVLIFRKGFPNNGQPLIDYLVRIGQTNLIEDAAHEQVCFLLQPSAHPELPHSDDAAQIIFKRGFLELTETATNGVIHWTRGNGSICFINETGSNCAFHLTCLILSASNRRVRLEQNGLTLWNKDLIANQAQQVDMMINARRGANTIHLKTDQSPVTPDNKNFPRVAIGVMNPQIVKSTPTGY